MLPKTKIICTIGPKTSSKEMLINLIDAGMNIARLNFSHGTHESHAEVIKLIKEIREEKKLPVGILLDTKGPEIRLGKFQEGIVNVKKGQRIKLVKEDIMGNGDSATLYPDTIFPFIKLNSKVLIDDGYVQATVVDLNASYIEIEIANDGVLKNYKSVSFHGVDIPLPFMTEKDRDDLKFGVEQQVDFIAASFVRYTEDIIAMRSYLEELGGSKIPVIAKIENRLGVENFESIVDLADGIMIARGDLGIELSVVELPNLQKKMARIAREKGRLCITATQMLESMIKNPVPTRAEVSDIANAIYDGTSAVMLSGETASGDYPLSAVNIMKAVINETEKQLVREHFKCLDESQCSLKVSSSLQALGLSTIHIAERADVKAVIVYTKTGGSPIFLSKYRPQVPIIAVTPCKNLYRSLFLEWGVFPMLTCDSDRTVWRYQACVYGIEKGLLSNYDKIIVLSRAAFIHETNSLTITVVNDILTAGTEG